MVQLYSFACGYPVIPAPLVEKTVLSSLNCHDILVDIYFSSLIHKTKHTICTVLHPWVFLFEDIIFLEVTIYHCIKIFLILFLIELSYWVVGVWVNAIPFSVFQTFSCSLWLIYSFWSPFDQFFFYSCVFVSYICILQGCKDFLLWLFFS